MRILSPCRSGSICWILRIPNEEQVLLRELPAYAEYAHKVRFRLIPGIW